MNALFENRTEAGKALAERVRKYAGPGVVVFGLGKGGTPVAAEIAHSLGAPLDILLVRTIELPCDQRTTIGAVGPEDVCVFDDTILDALDIESDAIDTLRCEADAAIEQENHSLRGGRPLPDVRNQTVILSDEIIDSTLKVRAAVLYLHQQEPRCIVVAATVVSKRVASELRLLVNDLVALDEPENAADIARMYVEAPPPSEAEIRRVLGVNEPTDGLLSGSPTDDA